MFDYFDLNDRFRRARKITGVNRSANESANLSPVYQVFIYMGIFIGVLFGTIVNQLGSEEGNITLTIGNILISAIVALILIPIEYEKLSLNPKSPFIVQFGIFVQNGVFWHAMIILLSKSI